MARASLLFVKRLSIVANRTAHQMTANDCAIGADAMRFVLALGLLIVLSTSANATTMRHAHPRHPEVDRPGANVMPPARFAVPGWSDEATQRWLNNASSNVGRGG
jgi:hypothetical protein